MVLLLAEICSVRAISAPLPPATRLTQSLFHAYLHARSFEMLASIRKRQASPPEPAMNAKRRAQELVAERLQARARNLEDHHQIRVQSCCNCAKISSTPHTLLSCTECNHTICTRCPVDDPLLLFPHPGLIRQRYEDMNKEGEHGDLGMGQSMLQRDQEHELGHDAEEEECQQEPQLQSQSQPTGKQRQVETGVPSKRSLNMSKCERCRLDKKKVCCLPILTAIYTSAAFKDNKDV